VAIIGILAAVAIPAYQDYTIRAKVSEVLVLASGARSNIAEYYLSTGSMPTNASASGINTDPAQSDYVQQIDFSTTATGSLLEYTLENLGTDANGKKVGYLVRGSSTGVKVDCSVGDLQDKFLPANCRK
jgi:type IV pilus assembly protein PilA